MYDPDDPVLRKRIAAQFADGTLADNEDIVALTHPSTDAQMKTIGDCIVTPCKGIAVPGLGADLPPSSDK